MRHLLYLFCLFVLLGVAQPALADEPLEERVNALFIGEEFYPQEAQALETGAEVGWVRAQERHTSLLTLGAEYGLTDRLQVELTMPMAAVSGDEARWGVTQVGAGVGWAFLNNARQGFGMSVSAEARLPSLSEGLGEEAYAFETGLTTLVELGALCVNVNTGLEFEQPTDDDGDGELGTEGVVSMFIPVGPVVPVIEAGLEVGEAIGARVALGLSWDTGVGFTLAAAGQAQLEDERALGAIFLLNHELELGEDD